jgi:(heptosyl)LPS beta-1,4-glucosyltransferase
VLVVDADERVTPQLAAEIRDLFAFPPPCDGYSLRRDDFFLGHKINHCGWSRSRLVRLFRRDVSRYRVRRVHADVEVTTGRVGQLAGRLEHYTATDLDHFIARQHRYSTWSALDAHDAGKRATWGKMISHAPLRFLQTYVLKGGFRDGRAGLVVCGLIAFYTFLKDAKLWALSNSRVPEEATATAAREALRQQQRRAA